MNIEQKLVSSVIGGLKALYGQDVPAAQVQLQQTKKEFEGHLTLVVFPDVYKRQILTRLPSLLLVPE